MKLTSYTPSVGQSNGVSARVQSGGDIKSYGADTSGVTALNKGLGQVQGVIMKNIEDNEALNVTAVNLEYVKRINNVLNDQKNGLLNTEQKGAEGITNMFTEQEQEIRKQVAGEFNIKYKKSLAAFDNMANRDAMTRFETVRKYETQQLQTYKNTTIDNKIQDVSTQAINNYADNNVLQNSLDSIGPLIEMRYGSAGEEVVKQQTRKAMQSCITGAATRAMQEGDTDRASSLMDKAGSLVPLQTRMNILGQVSKINRENQDLSDFQGIYEQYGGDIAGAEDYIRKNFTGAGISFDNLMAEMNKTKGQPYSLGTDGSNGSWDCGLWTKTMLGKVGVQLDNRCADYQYIQMENEGKAFNDKSQLKPGDLVFWHTTDKWKATNSRTPSDSEAYKGITHVGIYVGNGMAMQAGNSGVGQMSIDGAVGFGRTSGASYSPAQIENKIKGYKSFYSGREAVKKADENNKLEQAMNEINTVLNAGGTFTPAEIDSIAGRYAPIGTTLYNKIDSYAGRMRANNARESARGVSRGGAGYGSGFTKTGVENEMDGDLKQVILDGTLSNTDLSFRMAEMGLDANQQQAYLSANRKYQKSANNWSLISQMVREEDPNLKSAEIMNYGEMAARELRKTGSEATDQEIANYIIEHNKNTTPETGGFTLFGHRFFGTEGESEVRNYTKHKATEIKADPNGGYRVKYEDRDTPVWISEEDYEAGNY